MALSISHASDIPIAGARYSLTLHWVDSAGALTNPTSPDTKYSVDGGANFSDCAEEVSPTGGKGFITLTGAEMNNRSIILQSAGTGVLTAMAHITPVFLPVLESDTAQAGSATSITLAATASDEALYYNGCYIRTTSGTGGGGAGGANNQVRQILEYDEFSKVATIVGVWEVNPASDTTYEILLPVAVGTREALGAAAAAAGALQTHGDSNWATFDGGAVASVSGDVGGKILGGGESTITGTGARVVDAAGNAVATSAALATHDAKLDTVDGIVDAIAVDVAGLDGAAMRGTDSAALASVCTEARLAELDALNLPATTDAILADTGTDGVVVASLAANSVTAAAIAADAGVEIAAAVAALDPSDFEDDLGAGTLAAYLALWGPTHKRTAVDNGDGTATITVFKADGTTEWFEMTADIEAEAGTAKALTGVRDA